MIGYTGEVAEFAGLEALAAVVDPVARRFAAAGHRLFLVGGVVRDLALGESGPTDGGDIDLTTDAEPAVIRRLLAPLARAMWSQGERFGTIGATVDGQDIEVTTHRAEAYDPDSRQPVVTFGRDLAEDLSRRDFTINAMAVELPSHQLHDPFGGLSDLHECRLRTPLSAEVSFGDDPLRMLRAARFTARFGLTPTEELVSAAGAMAERLSIVSVERVADELERLLVVADPEPGFDLLITTGLLPRALPGFADQPAGAARLAARLAARPAADPVVRRAGLLWPIRERAGDELTRLRYARRDRIRTVRLLTMAERLLASEAGLGAVRRFVAVAGLDDLPLLEDLVDGVAAADPAFAVERGRRAIELLDALSADDLRDLGAPLSASEIMTILGLDPGPAVGRAQRHLLDLRLDRGPLTPDEARHALEEWWRQERGGDDSLPWGT